MNAQYFTERGFYSLSSGAVNRDRMPAHMHREIKRSRSVLLMK
jgi:hypothetical protein